MINRNCGGICGWHGAILSSPTLQVQTDSVLQNIDLFHFPGLRIDAQRLDLKGLQLPFPTNVCKVQVYGALSSPGRQFHRDEQSIRRPLQPS